MVAWIPVTGREAEEFLHSVSIRNGKDVQGASKAMKAIEARSASHHDEEVAKFLVPLTEQSTFLPHWEYCNDIPLIDLSSLDHNDHRQDATATTAALVKAAASWSVFQVVNHGLSMSVLEGAMAMTKEFFVMPEEEKQAYAQDYENGPFQGYKSTLDSFHMTRNLGSQLEYILHPESLSIKDNWPSTPAAYKDVFEEFGKGVYKLLTRIAELLLVGLGISTTSKTSGMLKGNLIQTLRLGHYEPCLQPEMALGHTPHLDHTLLTALVQDDTGGLEVNKDGHWYKVAPIPGAIIILLGDQIQTITNDNFKAVQHRVVLNPDFSRISIVCGITPSLDDIVSPALELVDDTHPALYHPYSYADFRLAQFQNWYTGQDALEKFRVELHEGGTTDRASKSPTISLDSPLNVTTTIKPSNWNPKSNNHIIQSHQDLEFQTPIFFKQGTLVA
jgi:flavonol synthase